MQLIYRELKQGSHQESHKEMPDCGCLRIRIARREARDANFDSIDASRNNTALFLMMAHIPNAPAMNAPRVLTPMFSLVCDCLYVNLCSVFVIRRKRNSDLCAHSLDCPVLYPTHLVQC